LLIEKGNNGSKNRHWNRNEHSGRNGNWDGNSWWQEWALWQQRFVMKLNQSLTQVIDLEGDGDVASFGFELLWFIVMEGEHSYVCTKI
jgi:hypothetical protein